MTRIEFRNLCEGDRIILADKYVGFIEETDLLDPWTKCISVIWETNSEPNLITEHEAELIELLPEVLQANNG